MNKATGGGRRRRRTDLEFPKINIAGSGDGKRKNCDGERDFENGGPACFLDLQFKEEIFCKSVDCKFNRVGY